MNNIQTIKDTIKTNNNKLIRLYTEEDMNYVDLEMNTEEELDELLTSWSTIPYSFLTLDDEDMILHDMSEIPEEAKELILEMILNKPKSATDNRLIKVFDLLEDDDMWMAIFIEAMVSWSIMMNNYDIRNIPEEFNKEVMRAYNYIEPDSFYEFDKIKGYAFKTVFLANEEKKELEQVKKFVGYNPENQKKFDKMKETIMEKKIVKIALANREENGREDFEREGDIEEEYIDYLICRFLLSNLATLSFVNEDGILKTLLNKNYNLTSLHDDVDYIKEVEKNGLTIEEWKI